MASGKVEPKVCEWSGACSNSEYGSVLKQRIAEDYRRWPGIARESNKCACNANSQWSRNDLFGWLYDKRSAVERVNGRFKEYLQLDDLTVRLAA